LRRAAGESAAPQSIERDEPVAAAASAEIAGFPSRAERLLRRALEARQ